MEEKKLNEKESLELITQMINSTKENFKVGSGNVFLLYGYASIILSVLVYFVNSWTQNSIWSLLWFLMFVPMVISMVQKKPKEKPVVTYTDRTIGHIWRVISALFILTVVLMVVLGFYFRSINFSLMLPLSLLYTAMGTSITGVVLKEKALTLFPLLGFVFALYMMMAFSMGQHADNVWNLYFGLSMLFMMVIPGHLLNSKHE